MRLRGAGELADRKIGRLEDWKNVVGMKNVDGRIPAEICRSSLATTISQQSRSSPRLRTPGQNPAIRRQRSALSRNERSTIGSARGESRRRDRAQRACHAVRRESPRERRRPCSGDRCGCPGRRAGSRKQTWRGSLRSRWRARPYFRAGYVFDTLFRSFTTVNEPFGCTVTLMPNPVSFTAGSETSPRFAICGSATLPSLPATTA